MATFLVEVDVGGCLLRSGLLSGELIVVLPEPDGRLLASRPEVVRMAFTANVDGHGAAPLGVRAVRPGRQLLLWPIGLRA